MQVVISKDTWQGMPIQQFDFLMEPGATPKDLGTGNVRILVSARKGCAPYVKWVWCGTKRKGWATQAYAWLNAHFGRKLRVSDVCGEESMAFHRRMRKTGLVEAFNLIR